MKKIVVIGSGTAGLVACNLIASLFRDYQITVVSSEQIGIIGVGEGSTEHWRLFQNLTNISVDDMVKHAGVTHKYGIRYEGWTNHTPDYFHSVGGTGLSIGSFMASYAHALSIDRQLTPAFSGRGYIEDKITDRGDQTHLGTNQYHFDTFLLNKYLRSHASKLGVNFLDNEIIDVVTGENGHIVSVQLKNNDFIDGDFFIDASGFHRALISRISDNDFVPYDKYLPCDSAIAFPTPPDPSGKIHPYTRARALSNGWMWEIPTQERRGNGYVFSSDFCSVDDAIKEASQIHGFQVTPAKTINFNAGYFKTTWKNNCFAIGLAASFVEPLEATSISTTIQQVRLLCSYLPTFDTKRTYGIVEYHRVMKSMMENILCMISLHYLSDRDDTPMWREQKNAPRPELLSHLLELWNVRSPEINDVPNTGYELFAAPHLWHVAQGQGVLNKDVAEIQLRDYGSIHEVREHSAKFTGSLLKEGLIDHAEALARTKNC
jgi:tryptophan halogenase